MTSQGDISRHMPTDWQSTPAFDVNIPVGREVHVEIKNHMCFVQVNKTNVDMQNTQHLYLTVCMYLWSRHRLAQGSVTDGD